MDKKEPEISYFSAIQVDVENVPVEDVGPNNTGPPILPDHQRFHCEKCQTHYDLPNGATSWRCRDCQTFNTTVPGECECCTIQ